MIDSKNFIIKTFFHDFNKFLFKKTKLVIKKIYFYKKKNMNKKREFLIYFLFNSSYHNIYKYFYNYHYFFSIMLK